MIDPITTYNRSLSVSDQRICTTLRRVINNSLSQAESKIWHGGPVLFIDGNPIVGYSKHKAGIQLMFWSGMSFDEPGLTPVGNVKKFKAAGMMYADRKELNLADIKRWLRKSRIIQWDYKNIIKRRGKLIRLR